MLGLKQVAKKARERRCKVYTTFLDLEKRMPALIEKVHVRYVLQMYGVGSKQLGGIKIFLFK